MGVLAIWRYPVKAMLGELLRSVRVGAEGLEGDRRWVVQDVRTGERIANKRGPTDARLRACRARLTPALEITLPDGRTAAEEEVADALSDLLERPVRLVAGHKDFAPVHLLTTRSLAHMRRTEPGTDWDPRRFRPNLVLDDGEAPGPAERELIGAQLRNEGLRLDVELPTPRCVVPSRAREDLPHDPQLLRSLVRENRWDLGPVGRQPCLGAYARVGSAGDVAVGDRLTVVPGTEPAETVVARVISELG